MVAYPLNTLSTARTGEDVESYLRPTGQSLRDLNRFVKRMIGWICTIGGVLRTWQWFRSVNGEVAVEFQHGCLGRNSLCAIYLDFVIILRSQWFDGQE
jgi:hypothetical protein